ncbi:hypothetical protein SNEBB_005927 [Seison nebaliae]|nr:hypothetical protein SNEBB_005927 [Seison nebaliae]
MGKSFLSSQFNSTLANLIFALILGFIIGNWIQAYYPSINKNYCIYANDNGEMDIKEAPSNKFHSISSSSADLFDDTPTNDKQMRKKNRLINQTNTLPIEKYPDGTWKFIDIPYDKRKVFIGVMTAQKFLDSRAVAVFDTWAQRIPGRVAFFSKHHSYSHYNIPFISLPLVDDAYPPQKKSFLMLKYIYETYGDTFEWFMRVDDDVYIKGEELSLFLSSLNSSKPYYIGQAGRGLKEEVGLLGLDVDENFCMGGPGILFSRETLRRMVPHISHCLTNLLTTHEDVEVGRCVRKFAGIPCSWSYDIKTIFYHNSSGNNAYTNDLLYGDVVNAISLHPIKKSQYQYRLHGFLMKEELKKFENRKIKRENIVHLKYRNNICLLLIQCSFSLVNFIHCVRISCLFMLVLSTITSHFFRIDNWNKLTKTLMDHHGTFEEFNRFQLNDHTHGKSIKIKNNLSKDHWKSIENDIINRYTSTPTLLKYRPYNRENVREWQLIKRTIYSSDSLSPKRGVFSSMRKSLLEMTRGIMEDMNKDSRQLGRYIEFKKLLYVHFRHNPGIGIDYIFDILLSYHKYSGKKMTFPVRRHVYLHQPYGMIEMKNIPLNLRNTKEIKRKKQIVHFVVPLAGRHEIFKRFVDNLRRLSWEVNGDNDIKVVFVIYDDIPSASGRNEVRRDNAKTRILIKKYQKLFPYADIRYIDVIGKFSRAIACEIGAYEFVKRREISNGENRFEDNIVYSQEFVTSKEYLKVYESTIKNMFSTDDDEIRLRKNLFSLLIFFIDIDMAMDNGVLDRVRLNTIENEQVYYPIVFSQYNKDWPNQKDSRKYQNADNPFFHNEVDGYWRMFGFGIVSIYYLDLRSSSGFNITINGWGQEDVDLYEKIVHSPNLKIFRSTDPGLTHIYHPIKCDSFLSESQMIMCLGTQTTSVTSLEKLASLAIEKKLYRKIN